MSHYVVEQRSTESPEWRTVSAEMTEADAEHMVKIAISVNYGKIAGYEVRHRFIDTRIKYVCVMLTTDDELEMVVGPFDKRAEAEYYGDANAVSRNNYIVRMLVAPVVG